MNKHDFITHLNQLLTSKLQTIQRQIDEIRLALAEDTKSTAGDKHETSRSMAQLEQEKLGKQYLETKKIQDFLSLISDRTAGTAIQIGDLIRTNMGWYYLGIPLGKVTLDTHPVFCISGASPLGTQLVGKRVLDRVQSPAGEMVIEEIL